MLGTKTPQQVFTRVIFTLGIYYYVWCAKAGGTVNLHIGKRVAISAWWFLFPIFGPFWWAWNFCEAVEVYSKGTIKKADAFLVFILSSLGGGVALNIFDVFSFLDIAPVVASHPSSLVALSGIIFSFATVLAIMAIFPAYIEAKLKKQTNQL